MMLRVLESVLLKGEVTSFESNGTPKLTLVLNESLDDQILGELESSFGGLDVRDRSGIVVRRSDRESIGSGYVVAFSVPRNRSEFVGKNFEDLLSDSEACLSEPESWMLIEKTTNGSYLSSWLEEPSIMVLRYRSAQKLCGMLQKHADHKDDGSFPTKVTFFEIERLDMLLIYSVEDLTRDFPITRLEDFFAADAQELLRLESFKGTLWDFLKNEDYDSRVARLLRSGDEFERRVRANHALARQNFRLDKRLEEVRKEIANLSSVISKLILGLEAKAFAIPGAMVLAAKVAKPEEGWNLDNLSVLIALFLVALILSASLWAQNRISCDLKNEIEEARSRYSIIDTDKKIGTKLDSLKGRLKIAFVGKVIVVLVAWVLFLGAVKMFCNMHDSTSDNSNHKGTDKLPLHNNPLDDEGE